MASLLRSAAVIAAVIALIAGGFYLWQDGAAPARSRFAAAGQLHAAYAKVAPGMAASGLARLGFDHTLPGAQTLSYLGTMEFFMPKSSRDFDRLDPAILACLAVRDRCGTYVFRLNRGASRKGTLFGFLAHAAPDSARAVFLMKRGRVAYKEMVGG
jgi:hypothetical protein